MNYICIHGHFYQPPRENAWLEAIEIQDSAHPYHDWNRRISAECYSANAYSRILDDAGRIDWIVNNYEKISFNFGPTLLAWMAKNVPDVYAAILEADRNSMNRYGGHGSALAQAYNHMIMPLANRADKDTQVAWGIRDFRSRFGRDPEGMWLPETAVDLETLEVLARQNIAFTILSPHQAARIRRKGDAEWYDVTDGSIDPKRAYRLNLPGGGSIVLFFYDGPISNAVGFEGLLNDGKAFADRLIGGFVDDKSPQLSHIATDGESYGHHSPHGDMALAYALHCIESGDRAQLTNYGQYLENHPPQWEVEIKEQTAWSCAHGVDRWRTDCGCSSGQNPSWHQRWRRPLREALDYLRDELAQVYETHILEYFKDPWKARNDYISVVLDRSAKSVDAFFKRHSKKAYRSGDSIKILQLMEMQRHAMLMYTSCGWFFDDISGIETVQVIQYAGRAIQLHDNLEGGDLEARFLKKLFKAPSNIPAHGNGRRIYEKFVKPAMVDLKRVAAHYAISSLFEDYEGETPIFCCTVSQKEYRRSEAGKTRLAAGRVKVGADITQETEDVYFGVLYLGDHQLICGLSRDDPSIDFAGWSRNLFEGFERADFPRIMQRLNETFDGSMYSLKSLFKDGQRKIVTSILETKIDEALSVYRHVYEANVPLFRFLKDSNTPTPEALFASGRFILNADLKSELEKQSVDYDRITELLKDADLTDIPLEANTLEYTLRKNLERTGEAFQAEPERGDLLEQLARGVDLVYALPFHVNLRKLQNIFYELKHDVYPKFRPGAGQDDKVDASWSDHFLTLCRQLNLKTTDSS